MYFKRLKELRKQAGLNQTQAGEIISSDQRLYSMYETGKREIPFRLVILLANYYKTSLDYIAERTNER